MRKFKRLTKLERKSKPEKHSNELVKATVLGNELKVFINAGLAAGSFEGVLGIGAILMTSLANAYKDEHPDDPRNRTQLEYDLCCRIAFKSSKQIVKSTTKKKAGASLATDWDMYGPADA